MTISDRALRALERGEPIYEVCIRAGKSEGVIWVQASDQFWLTCIEALRRTAASASVDEDNFQLMHQALCENTGFRPA